MPNQTGYTTMHMLITLLHRLLADISDNGGGHLVPPDDLAMSWILTEGPKLDKALLQVLESGGAENPGLPEWLTPLWDRFVLKRDVGALSNLRQILVFGYKAEYEPTEQQLDEAVKGFVDCDATVGVWADNFERGRPSEAFPIARQLVGLVIYKVDWLSIIPSHGPGAVFPPRRPCNKSNFDTMYSSIQRWYPWDSHFCAIPSFWVDSMVEGSLGPINELDEIQCRLQAVPKDSRGPRLICVHPAEAIWIQQGQRRVLERAISTSNLTKKVITFHDQTTNGYLAQVSSWSGEFVTLDLKEASDRLSSTLVRYLFGDAVSEWMSAARAQTVQLPSGDRIRLNKWAPMGNCLTFPVQSLCFWALVRAGIRYHHGTDCDEVYVFGDDIMFPSRFYDGAVRALVAAGLVPNVTKTFRLGSFRESCGVDAFDGIDVTPFRARRAQVASVSDAVSWCDLAKRLRRNGWLHSASFIYSQVNSWLRSCFGRYLPLCNNFDAQGIFEYVMDARTVILYGRIRFDRAIQEWQSEYLPVHSLSIEVRVGDWYHLQDSLLRLELLGPGDSERGLEYSVPHRERLSCGWTRLLM